MLDLWYIANGLIVFIVGSAIVGIIGMSIKRNGLDAFLVALGLNILANILYTIAYVITIGIVDNEFDTEIFVLFIAIMWSWFIILNLIASVINSSDSQNVLIYGLISAPIAALIMGIGYALGS